MAMIANVDLIMVTAGSQGPADKAHVPLGLLYVGSELERYGFNVKIWHLLPEEFIKVLPRLQERKPLWIGISVLSGMTTNYAYQLSKQLKRKIPKSPIVWGGHHASAIPQESVCFVVDIFNLTPGSCSAYGVSVLS